MLLNSAISIGNTDKYDVEFIIDLNRFGIFINCATILISEFYR